MFVWARMIIKNINHFLSINKIAGLKNPHIQSFYCFSDPNYKLKYIEEITAVLDAFKTVIKHDFWVLDNYSIFIIVFPWICLCMQYNSRREWGNCVHLVELSLTLRFLKLTWKWTHIRGGWGNGATLREKDCSLPEILLKPVFKHLFT